MDDKVVIEHFLFMSPVITERADGVSATIRGITLKGPVTRNKNLYTPSMKAIIASGLIGKPIVFGFITDHINPEDFPEHDIVAFLGNFRAIAAKYTIGHITEAWYDASADLIRYVGSIRNTVDNPDVVERVAAKDLVFTSIGGIGNRSAIIHPQYGAVKQVMSCETTHMAFVAIPGDATSQIQSVVIQESLDLKHSDVETITEVLKPEEIKALQDELEQAKQDKIDAETKLKTEKEARELLEASSPKDVQTLLAEIKDIQKKKDELADKLGLSEDERKKLEALNKDAPTAEQVQTLVDSVKDVDLLRAEVKEYKDDKDADTAAKKFILLAEVIDLVGYKDDDDKAAKTEQFGKFESDALQAIKDETTAKRKKYDEDLDILRRQQSSGGAVKLGSTGYIAPGSLQAQYKDLDETQKNRLWELWVNDTVGKMLTK